MEHSREGVISADSVRSACRPAIYRRGEAYARAGNVMHGWRQEGRVGARCRGLEPEPYFVFVEVDVGKPGVARCDCAYDWGDYCKHIVAVLLAYAAEPERFPERPSAIGELMKRPAGEIETTLRALANTWAPFEEWLAARLGMEPPRGPESDLDPAVFSRGVRSIIHGLDSMRRSDAYWHVSEVTAQVREMAQDAGGRVARGEVRDGMEMLLILAESMCEAFEVLDDSDGEVRALAEDIADELVAALTIAELTDDRRQAIAERLLGPTREMADYGIGDSFEDARLIALAGASGMAGLDEEARGRLVTARLRGLARSGDEEAYLELARESGRDAEYAEALIRSRRAEALPAALSAARSTEAALWLAHAFFEAGNAVSALQVARHGLDAHGDKVLLASWLAPLAESLEDHATALRAYMESCSSAPTVESYRAVRRLSGEAWESARQELLAAARRASATGILLEEELWDEAIAAVEARGPLDYDAIERVVVAVHAARPDWAIRACQQQVQVLTARAIASRYEPAARWLEHMRDAYVAAGRSEEWETYFGDFLERYRRRPALLRAVDHLKGL